jgi:FkbM family methyltransferase
MRVETFGPVAAAHLLALRLAAKTGRIRRAAIALGRMFPASPEALIHLDGGAALAVPLTDPYWATLLVGWDYEPEVHRIMDAAIAHRPEAVLYDCGANIGYWGACYASKVPVVAVEAALPTYRRLARTAAANGFQAHHAAVWDQGGLPLTISWHADNAPGASVTRQKGRRSSEVVSITLDDLYYADAPLARRLPIVKLDVEDAELPAIDGASKLRDQALWVYEDHGKDPTHKVTLRFLELGFMVADVRPVPARQVIEARQLDEVKVNPTKGYNFVAWRNDGPWADLPALP